MENKQEWDWEINSHTRWFQWNLGELWHYKDLLFRLVRRDLIANYQQTLLGPFWLFMQPLLTTLVYYLIFGQIIKINTGGVPAILFYLSGIIFWSYFSDCLNGTMYTFVQNATLFSKVYFPRLIVPISGVISHTIRMGIQFLLFVLIYLFYLSYPGIHGSAYILLVPILFLLTAGFGLGAGLIISVLTARYRDLDYTLQFLLRLFMFATPVVYPASIIPAKYQFYFLLNPLTIIIETCRAAFFSNAPVYTRHLFLCGGEVILLIILGITLFKKQELKVMDVV